MVGNTTERYIIPLSFVLYSVEIHEYPHPQALVSGDLEIRATIDRNLTHSSQGLCSDVTDLILVF